MVVVTGKIATVLAGVGEGELSSVGVLKVAGVGVGGSVGVGEGVGLGKGVLVDVGVGDGVIVEIGALASVCVGVGSGVDSTSTVTVGVDAPVGEWVGVGGLSKPNVQAASRIGARRMIIHTFQRLGPQIAVEFDHLSPLKGSTSLLTMTIVVPFLCQCHKLPPIYIAHQKPSFPKSRQPDFR